LYFLTTLYVDVKEPAPNFFGVKHSRTFQSTKKLNVAPDRPSFAKATAGKRDKIESNLQSQMYVERTPGLEESRFQRDQQISPD
jgi:hypothetical protein